MGPGSSPRLTFSHPRSHARPVPRSSCSSPPTRTRRSPPRAQLPHRPRGRLGRRVLHPSVPVGHGRPPSWRLQSRHSRPAAASLRRQRASPLGTVTAIEAIVHQDDRRPSNGATGGDRPLLLLDAWSGSPGGAGKAAALVIAIQEFVANGGGRPPAGRRLRSVHTPDRRCGWWRSAAGVSSTTRRTSAIRPGAALSRWPRGCRCSSVREARRREPAVVCQEYLVVRSAQFGGSPAVVAACRHRNRGKTRVHCRRRGTTPLCRRSETAPRRTVRVEDDRAQASGGFVSGPGRWWRGPGLGPLPWLTPVLRNDATARLVGRMLSCSVLGGRKAQELVRGGVAEVARGRGGRSRSWCCVRTDQTVGGGVAEAAAGSRDAGSEGGGRRGSLCDAARGRLVGAVTSWHEDQKRESDRDEPGERERACADSGFGFCRDAGKCSAGWTLMCSLWPAGGGPPGLDRCPSSVRAL